MNQKQIVALEVLCNRINNERESYHVESKDVTVTVDEMGKAFCEIPIEGFPVVSIGKQGGYDMPHVRSYPQENGFTALDACVYGDYHLARQAEGRKKGRVLPYKASI